MANEEHLAILKQGVEAWNQWRKENPEIRPNLGGANLSRENLHRANLSRSSLLRAKLGWADLGWAKLRGADLRWADFHCADLSEANLNGAYLNWANLNEANLDHARVGYTNFGDVDLSRVKGLASVQYVGPSTIGIDTLYKSRGKIPEVFLRGRGVPDQMIAFIASLAGQPETYRVRLRMMIDEHFNKSELQTLCFDMNMDYDSLNGENKSDKARELVGYFQRRGTIRDLVAKCKELRPKVEWEGEYE